MSTYLLIVLVIALALAPLGHFLPSKRQRKLARMREYAALHGLFVEFRHAPLVPGESRPVEQVIYYGKRIRAALAKPVETAAWVKTDEGWRCVGGRLPPPPPIAELSTEIRAASVDQASCGVYWTESAEEESVEQIRQALERWSDLLGR
jgi:hypothetical protein